MERRFGREGRRARLRAIHLILIATLGLVPASCSGDGNPTGSLSARFLGSGAAAAADLVRMVSGEAAGDVVTVHVNVGGPSTVDLYGFAFDLILDDPSVARYIENSASVGDALKTGSGHKTQVAVRQDGNRVIVAVTKLGVSAPSTVDAIEESVVSLQFRVKRRGITPLRFDGPTEGPSTSRGPAAFDSGGRVLRQIEFDSAPAAIQGA